MGKVAIIDYGMGNIDSVLRAVEECGAEPVLTNEKAVLETCSSIILPGVGAFSDAMRQLKKLSLDLIIKEQVLEKNIPFLGICLGMQLLASRGTEGGDTEGLNLIKGSVARFESNAKDIRIPHMGWNEVVFKTDSQLFNGIDSGKDFYFVHSYHFKPDNDSDIAGTTPYCGEFVSVVGRGLIFGTQFHPEKSQKTGFRLLRNFLEI
ncbi:MAG: imidazole glycerol phosphate synthase subunit HisH [Victivallales bacterium]